VLIISGRQAPSFYSRDADAYSLRPPEPKQNKCPLHVEGFAIVLATLEDRPIEALSVSAGAGTAVVSKTLDRARKELQQGHVVVGRLKIYEASVQPAGAGRRSV
jgi:hypothetical protein